MTMQNHLERNLQEHIQRQIYGCVMSLRGLQRIVLDKENNLFDLTDKNRSTFYL